MNNNINTKKNCRLCLSENTLTIDIFDKHFQNMGIKVKLDKYISIQINKNDNYSTRICHRCITALEDFDTFINKVRYVDKVLKTNESTSEKLQENYNPVKSIKGPLIYRRNNLPQKYLICSDSSSLIESITSNNTSIEKQENDTINKNKVSFNKKIEFIYESDDSNSKEGEKILGKLYKNQINLESNDIFDDENNCLSINTKNNFQTCTNGEKFPKKYFSSDFCDSFSPNNELLTEKFKNMNNVNKTQKFLFDSDDSNSQHEISIRKKPQGTNLNIENQPHEYTFKRALDEFNRKEECLAIDKTEEKEMWTQTFRNRIVNSDFDSIRLTPNTDIVLKRLRNC